MLTPVLLIIIIMTYYEYTIMIVFNFVQCYEGLYFLKASCQLTNEKSTHTVHDVLLPSVANTFRCFMQ